MDTATLRAEAPGSPAGRLLRVEYWHDVAARCGLPAGDGPPPGDERDLVPPRGTFLVASRAGQDLGCAGVRLIADGDAEVKRLYVRPAARGLRLGRTLLDATEAWARDAGARRLVLDTHRALSAALGLYAAAGFAEVEPYNDNPDAQLWFAKPLG